MNGGFPSRSRLRLDWKAISERASNLFELLQSAGYLLARLCYIEAPTKFTNDTFLMCHRHVVNTRLVHKLLLQPPLKSPKFRLLITMFPGTSATRLTLLSHWACPSYAVKPYRNSRCRSGSKFKPFLEQKS